MTSKIVPFSRRPFTSLSRTREVVSEVTGLHIAIHYLDFFLLIHVAAHHHLMHDHHKDHQYNRDGEPFLNRQATAFLPWVIRVLIPPIGMVD